MPPSSYHTHSVGSPRVRDLSKRSGAVFTQPVPVWAPVLISENDVNCQKPDALLQRGHASTQRVPFAPSSLNPSDLHRRHPPPPLPRRGAVDMGTPSVKDYSIVFVSPMPGDKQGISIREVLQRRYNYLKTGKEPKTFPVANPFTPVLAGFPVHWDKTLDSIEVVIKWPGYEHINTFYPVWLLGSAPFNDVANQIALIVRSFFEDYEKAFREPGVRIAKSGVPIDSLRLVKLVPMNFKAAMSPPRRWIIELSQE